MSGDPVSPTGNTNQAVAGQIRLAKNSGTSNGFWSFLAAGVECNQIGEINREFEALKEELKAGPSTKLYLKFKILTERLINKIYSCEDRYLQLENLPPVDGISVSRITLNSAILDSDLKSFLEVLPSFPPSEQLEIEQVATRQILLPNPNQIETSQHIGRRMIQALHRKASSENSQKLWQNLRAGMQLFAGVPFRLGPRGNYVKTNGHLSGEGIECISYANILINLASGIKKFSPYVGGMTGPDMFVRKPEFVSAGIRQAPVISRLKMDTAKANDIEKLLEEYGEFFVAQIYYQDSNPFHIVIVYKDRADGTFKITEAAVGKEVVYGESFSAWYKNNCLRFGYLTFNLVNPAKVQDFAHGKSKDFMTDLTADIKKAKQ